MARQTAPEEPRIRIILSPRGIQGIEVWGRNDSDQSKAMQLFFKLSGVLNQVNETCRS